MARFLKLDFKKIRKLLGGGKQHRAANTFAAGVGGAITGRGADLLIIDDPSLGARCDVSECI